MVAWRWVALGAALAAVAWIAPLIQPAVLFPVSIGWLIGLVALVAAGARRLSARLGRGATLTGFVVLAATIFGLTGVQWSGSLATRLPCHRNWAWLPSYLLRSSPTRAVTGAIGDLRFKVCYGSPRSRGRRMIGGTHVPFGQLWRTGANEPTTIRANGPITIADIPVATGLASLYTVPGPETWEVVVNGSTTQWGIESEYPSSAELGRRVVPARQRVEPIEAFEISVELGPRPTDPAELVLSWETTEIRVPIGRLPRVSSDAVPAKSQGSRTDNRAR